MPPRTADVRFYIDADLLGLAKTLAPLRSDLTYPGDPGATVHRRERPPCPTRPAGVRDNGLRMVALSGPQARGTWEQLELLLIQWRRIETLQALPGPFCYVATRTTLRAVDL